MRRVRIGVALFGAVLVVGTAGYVVLGFSLLDAAYQTVTTVTTVGFREVRELSPAGKIFTMVLILVGVGTALYTFGVLLEVLIEGELRDVFGRRRMEREIARLSGHVIICGWGRVGREIARFLTGAGERVVVVDIDPARLAGLAHLHVVGDATEDETLRRAGIERARALVAALATDADNLFVTVSGRALRPDLVIIARARDDASEPKLRRAGATETTVRPGDILIAIGTIGQLDALRGLACAAA